MPRWVTRSRQLLFKLSSRSMIAVFTNSSIAEIGAGTAQNEALKSTRLFALIAPERRRTGAVSRRAAPHAQAAIRCTRCEARHTRPTAPGAVRNVCSSERKARSRSRARNARLRRPNSFRKFTWTVFLWALTTRPGRWGSFEAIYLSFVHG